MTKEKILKILLILTLFLPPFVIAKSLLFPFVSGKAYLFRFFVEISFFFWLLLILENKKYLPNFKNPLVFSLILFSLGLIITGLLGVDPIHSFFSEIERCDGIIQYLHWVLYFLMLISVFKERKDWQIFATIFVILAVLVSLFGWGQYLSDSKIFFYGKKRPRIEGTFGNPDYMPVFLIFAMAFLSWLYFEFKKKNKKFEKKDLGFLALFLFFLLTFLFTQTRGAYFGLGCGFIFFTLFFNLYYFRQYKKIALFLLILIFLGAVFWGILLHFKEADWVKKNPIFKRLTIELSLEKGSLAQRLRTWKVALEVFKERPILGWGPENFFAGFNKHLDPRIPEAGEPWFDKVHNQYLQILCEGGIFLFVFYLIFIGGVLYLCFRLIKNKEKRFPAALLTSFYLAYLFQAIFLFDTFPMYLGLFPFLALLYFETEALKERKEEKKKEIKEKKKIFEGIKIGLKILGGLLLIFLLIECVWLPYKSNKYLRFFISAFSSGYISQAEVYFNEALKINSPFTLFDIQKRGGWTLISFPQILEKFKDSQKLKNLYEKITSELEKGKKVHPYDPQVYFILGRLYWMGEKSLGIKDGYQKAKEALKEGLKLSPKRPIYLMELAQVYIYEENYPEAEKILNFYANEVAPFSWRPYEVLGHFYYIIQDYQKAEKVYLKAIELGWHFWKEKKRFERLILTLKENQNWSQIAFAYEKYLKHHPDDAQAWYNFAVALKKIGKTKEASSALEKAFSLNPNLKNLNGN